MYVHTYTYTRSYKLLNHDDDGDANTFIHEHSATVPKTITTLRVSTSTDFLIYELSVYTICILHARVLESGILNAFLSVVRSFSSMRNKR